MSVEAFKIIGGNKIKGQLSVEGAKNAALPILVATLIERKSVV